MLGFLSCRRTVCIITFLVLGFQPTSIVNAKEIVMIAPEIPPHFDASGKGRIGDVISAALRNCGHTVRFTTVPFGRHWQDYKDFEHFDGLATAEADQTFPGYSTIPFIHLQDGATVTEESGLSDITSVQQLAGYHVVAFPNADKILGLQANMPKFKSFRMRANRFDQLRPILAGRADAILADGLITAHFLQILRDRANTGKEPYIAPGKKVFFRKIFNRGPQRLYFRDKTIANDFDRCVSELIDTHEIENITKPYVDKFRSILSDQYPNY